MHTHTWIVETRSAKKKSKYFVTIICQSIHVMLNIYIYIYTFYERTYWLWHTHTHNFREGEYLTYDWYIVPKTISFQFHLLHRNKFVCVRAWWWWCNFQNISNKFIVDQLFWRLSLFFRFYFHVYFLLLLLVHFRCRFVTSVFFCLFLLFFSLSFKIWSSGFLM